MVQTVAQVAGAKPYIVTRAIWLGGEVQAIGAVVMLERPVAAEVMAAGKVAPKPAEPAAQADKPAAPGRKAKPAAEATP